MYIDAAVAEEEEEEEDDDEDGSDGTSVHASVSIFWTERSSENLNFSIM